MKRTFVLVLAAVAVASLVSTQAETKGSTPVYDPLTWRADTIQGVAGYVVTNAQGVKDFLPMKNLADGKVLGKLQAVNLSDYSRGWSYIPTAAENNSVADNNKAQKKAEKRD